jgi:very-short-patch-repair endonuclease
LIEHAYDPGHLMRALEDEYEKKSQSPLEREVMKRLVSEGYQVTPHWRVGKYRIDLVVEGDGKRMAIECEGDPAYPMEIHRLPEEMERQATLERLGWVFTRVRATEFLRDPQRAMQPVFNKLEVLEISPDLNEDESNVDRAQASQSGELPLKPVAGRDLSEGESESLESQSAGPDGLVERVIRRADELRQEWRAA